MMKYSPFDTFVYRTPALSTNTVKDLTASDIKKLCSKPEIAEAIYLASPELYQEVKKYIEGNEIKNNTKLEYSLLKYFLRMGYRCTPFGIFSGCSTGKLGVKNKIELEERALFKRKTRPDMHYLCTWALNIEKEADIRQQLRFFSNTTLYQVGNELRYVEYKYIGFQRKHFVVSIESSEYVEMILERAKVPGGATLEELALTITDDEITIEDATAFINELIDNQILISSIAPTLSGNEYFETLEKELADTKYAETIKAIKDKLNSIDSNDTTVKDSKYADLNELLLSINSSAHKKFLLQTDLRINSKEAFISNTVGNQITEALRIMNRLREPFKNYRLENFKKAFFERYETEEIPLSLALDVETGIGYSGDKSSYTVSPLIDDLYFPPYTGGNEQNQISWNQADFFFFHKIQELKTGDKKYIQIKDEDIAPFKENWDDLPITFSVLSSIVAMDNDSEEAQVYIDFVGGSSACNLLSRFSTLDNGIQKHILEIAGKEEQHDRLYAEIVHLPEARTGNILHRPHLRKYEIPYLASSTMEGDSQLALSDIYVSVKNDRIVLRSRKHNKQIVPMLSNAHNFVYNSLPVYHFLCDMQTQGLRSGLNINLDNLKQFFDYIPRIVYKNVILSPAQWVLDTKDIAAIKDIPSLLRCFQKKNIPNKVLLTEGDNELLINLENSLSLEMFIAAINNRGGILLKEYLFEDEKALVKRNAESFTNEVIFSYYKSVEKAN